MVKERKNAGYFVLVVMIRLRVVDFEGKIFDIRYI
jgi:hypothetical protein